MGSMEARLVTVWVLIALIAVVLAVTIRHARRAEREITPPLRRPRKARADNGRDDADDPARSGARRARARDA
jgi:hypothetical protein